METNGHLSETLMETKTTFRLVVAPMELMAIILEDLTQMPLDGQLGQIQQVRKLSAPTGILVCIYIEKTVQVFLLNLVIEVVEMF